MNRKIKISVGVPVFNGEKTIRNALNSLTSQTFKDFEIIISDNASTDKTQEICKSFASNDSRIRYIRQPKNLGITRNFKIVLDEARGDFFTWAACDDVRSEDFLKLNYEFLIKHPNYVASTSPDSFSSGPLKNLERNKFSLKGNLTNRFLYFFKVCWRSHGIFCALIRANIIKKCDVVGKDSFLGQDWAIILFVLKNGKINRVNKGFILFGPNGISSKPDYLKKQGIRHSFIEKIVPFYKLFQYVMTIDFKINLYKLLYVFFRINSKVHFSNIVYYLRKFKKF